ncbi:HAD family hydrolase [Haloferula sp. A504]|uniref:HAD family hydrolase n=1 Tax=Haloferula sp. A504 TaxID=3373601 RepID=UPI0031BEB846|nr:haloacid dehalogenase-like hydrolase [Verrucomicrobiaceae bacterium E54]
MSAPARLWLFDIDGTLVDTGGAGMRALKDAAHECFGAEGPELDLAGSTDSGIVADMFRHFGQEPDEAGIESFYALYLEHLERHLGGGRFPGRVLAGALEMLEVVAGREDITVGLLTGNIESGARAKMRHYGLDHHFGFGAYGCDHPDRNRLGPVALERAAAHAGRTFTPEETLIIGDTPKDIACARALGARCLAVATGSIPADGLQEADHVLASLEEREVWEKFLS